MNTRKLAAWVADSLLTPPKVRAFELRHAGIENASELIYRRTVRDGEGDGDATRAADLITADLARSAHDHVEAFSHLQRYKIEAKDEAEETQGQFAFRLAGKSPGIEVGQSEPPTQVGLTAQLMRHNEAIMALLIQSNGQVVGGLVRENESLRTRILETDELRFQHRKEMEEMLSTKAERDLAMQKWQADEKRKGELVKKATDLILPQATKHLVKKLGLDKDMVQDFATDVRDIIGSAPMDKFMEFVGSLPPAARAKLERLMEQTKEAEAAKSEAKETSE